jgi:hypothetical protein
MHQEPVWFHKFETIVNHFVELIAPVLLMMPGWPGAVGGLIQIIFQVTYLLFVN